MASLLLTISHFFRKCGSVDFGHASHSFEGSKVSDLNQFAPQIGTNFPPQIWGPTPDMVWGHNLQHMAPVGALTSGFCMFFDSPALIFLTPDPIFGGQDLGPRRPGGPFLGPKRGPGKHDFVEGLVPHEVSRDCLRGERFLWYPGILWVYPFPPKPSQGGVLQGFPPNPKIPGAPLGPWMGCLFALCGPVAYCRGRWHGQCLLKNLRWQLEPAQCPREAIRLTGPRGQGPMEPLCSQGPA